MVSIDWIGKSTVRQLHDEQLVEHGGRPGFKDEGALSAALMRPQNLLHYAERDLDIFDLAAAYAFGLARGHVFIDGNKRTSFVVTRLFLELNGHPIRFSTSEGVSMWTAIAAGLLPEDQIAELLRRRGTQSPDL